MKAQIRKTVIGAARQDSDRLIYALGREGIIHTSPWKRDGDGAVGGLPSYAALEKKAAAILASVERLRLALGADADIVPAPLPDDDAAVFMRDADDDTRYVDSVRGAVEELENRRGANLAAAEVLRAQTAAAEGPAFFPVAAALSNLQLCDALCGTIEKEPDPACLAGAGGHFIRKAGNRILGLSPSGRSEELLALLSTYGFREDAKAPPEAKSPPDHDRAAGMEDLGREMQEIDGRLGALRNEHAARLAELYRAYAVFMAAMYERKKFLHTGDTVFIGGWIDADRIEQLTGLLRRTCGSRFYLYIYTMDEMARLADDVPVRLKNNRFFRSFEMLVRNIGLPAHSEIDPTPFAAISFLLIFGVMFGDIGQGLVLAAAGAVLKVAARRARLGPLYGDAGTILISAGFSASIFGVLYGSVFSSEHLVSALWFHPMQHIMDLFLATIMMGAFLIALGMVFNVINLMREGSRAGALFGTRGLAGLAVYVGSLFLLARYRAAGISPGGAAMALVYGVPLGAFMLRNILERLLFGSGAIFPHGVFEYIVESMVEILEMCSGYIGNTVSFIRAGAFALSHAGLSIAVYTLAEMAGPGPSPGSAAVIITGNVFIILLEGLVCGIQSMRLEYYEFFGKFFRGGGTEFTPVNFTVNSPIIRGGAL
jgi:vacuolar-type H+-ATPase subunit I/STV1